VGAGAFKVSVEVRVAAEHEQITPRTYSTSELRVRIEGLNHLLTELYGRDTRLSTLLADLGFSERQISALKQTDLIELVDCTIHVLMDSLGTRRDGARLCTVVVDRFGLLGAPCETLQEVGTKLGVSRERARQLQQKSIRALKARHRNARLEAEILLQASIWVGEPANHLPPADSISHPFVDEAVSTQSMPVESAVATEATRLASVAEAVATVLQQVGGHLGTTMLAHVLHGSHGPVVDAVAEHYRISERGLLRGLGFTQVKRLIDTACAGDDRLSVADGVIRLRRDPRS
jgi:hypothetical protein